MAHVGHGGAITGGMPLDGPALQMPLQDVLHDAGDRGIEQIYRGESYHELRSALIRPRR